MILPYDANPGRMKFSERTGMYHALDRRRPGEDDVFVLNAQVDDLLRQRYIESDPDSARAIYRISADGLEAVASKSKGST